jgi:hypothetical protein
MAGRRGWKVEILGALAGARNSRAVGSLTGRAPSSQRHRGRTDPSGRTGHSWARLAAIGSGRRGDVPWYVVVSAVGPMRGNGISGRQGAVKQRVRVRSSSHYKPRVNRVQVVAGYAQARVPSTAETWLTKSQQQRYWLGPAIAPLHETGSSPPLRGARQSPSAAVPTVSSSIRF